LSTTKSADRPHGRAGGALGRFEAALSALEEHAGDNPELLAVGVLPSMAEFQVTDGQSARGYRYHAEGGEMGELKVKLVDPGRSSSRQIRTRPGRQTPPGGRSSAAAPKSTSAAGCTACVTLLTSTGAGTPLQSRE